MTPASTLPPVVIDDARLQRLAAHGYRWLEGRVEHVRYRWLLPPDWVLASELPARTRGGIVPLAGGGDRQGRATGALGFLAGANTSPLELVQRGASGKARIGSFSARLGPVAERVESHGGKMTVTTVHAFRAGGESFRFFVAAIGLAAGSAMEDALRTVGLGLSLFDEWSERRRERLHG